MQNAADLEVVFCVVEALLGGKGLLLAVDEVNDDGKSCRGRGFRFSPASRQLQPQARQFKLIPPFPGFPRVSIQYPATRRVGGGCCRWSC